MMSWQQLCSHFGSSSVFLFTLVLVLVLMLCRVLVVQVTTAPAQALDANPANVSSSTSTSLSYTQSPVLQLETTHINVIIMCVVWHSKLSVVIHITYILHICILCSMTANQYAWCVCACHLPCCKSAIYVYTCIIYLQVKFLTAE